MSLSRDTKQKKKEETYKQDMLNGVQAVFWELWAKEYGASVVGNPYEDPTEAFIMATMVDQSGSFIHPKAITSDIAKLTFISRLAFAFEYRHHHQRPIEEQIPGYDQMSNLERVKCFTPYVTVGQPYPFHNIRSRQALLSSAALEAQKSPEMVWVDDDLFESFHWKGELVHINQMRSVVHKMQADMLDQLRINLLWITDYHDQIKDDLTSTTPGYSIFDEESNHMFKDKSILISAILRTPYLVEIFFPVDPITSKRRVSRGALRNWLNEHEELMVLMLAYAELNIGGNARCTELLYLTFRATLGRPVKGMSFVSHGVALIRAYTKTGRWTGSDKWIPSAPDACFSDILIQSVAVLRPFAEWAVSILHSSDPHLTVLYRDALFPAYGGYFNTTQVSKVLEKYSTQAHLPQAGVRTWRQWIVGMQRMHCPTYTDAANVIVTPGDAMIAASTGHSVSTSFANYGVGLAGHFAAPDHLLRQLIHHSKECHIVNRTVPPGPGLSMFNARAENFSELVANGRIRDPDTIVSPVNEKKEGLRLVAMRKEMEAISESIDTMRYFCFHFFNLSRIS